MSKNKLLKLYTLKKRLIKAEELFFIFIAQPEKILFYNLLLVYVIF